MIQPAMSTGSPAPMSWRRVLAIGLCVALNALDGFDVLSISFAAPGIAREWHIARAALGMVLSIELVGMAVGSLVLGQVADRIGRRPTVLGCLTAMALGMTATSQVDSIALLALARLFTGLGIGGMLAVTNALVAEYASDRRRSASVAIMAAGYPLGAVLGGMLAGVVLVSGDWRAIFLIGAGFAALLLPLVTMLLPEPASIGSASVEPGLAVPPVLAGLFSPGVRLVTVSLTIAYLCHILTFYFILKWVPKIVVDMGFSAANAAHVLVWSNVGGLVGALSFSFLCTRIPLRRLLSGALLLSGVAVAAFGQVPVRPGALSAAAAVAGMAANGGVVLFYALIASSFPTPIRAGGTGFVIGVGRGGAMLGPVMAGFLFQAGLTLPAVSALMAIGSLAAVVALRIGR